VQESLTWLAATLFVLTLALWKPAQEKTRLRTSAVFLLLWVLTWLGMLLPLPWRLSSLVIHEVAVAFLALSGVQVGAILIFDLALRRVHFPKFLYEMLVVAGYIATLLHLLVSVGVNVTGIFATSAVATAVLGLALQDMLSNIAGGIALELEDGIRVGDFVTTTDAAGWVRHIRLRHTALKTRDGDTVILPNSQLTRSTFTITSRCHRIFLPFSMPYAWNAQEVIEAVEFALRVSPIPGVAPEPQPRCLLQKMDAGSMHYVAVIYLTEPGQESYAVSATLVRLSFALQRAGLPVREITTVVEMYKEAPQAEKPNPVDLLRRTPILRLLDDMDLNELASYLQPVSFAPGESIIRQGEAGDSMYFVVAGNVSISFRAPDGSDRQVSVMDCGDFFGEASLLTGEIRTASAFATTKVDCYRLDKKGLQHIISNRNDLAEDMSVVMAHRQVELAVVREKLDHETARKREAENQQQLLVRIRRFFEIPPAR
jgi:small-conductance mechanosensitive channel/CRP-like cAMP-binding protein